MNGFKLEMHLHTLGNSRCAKVSADRAAKIYADAGYDGVVVTNHWNRNIAENYFADSSDKINEYLKGYYAMKATGIHTLFGVELALREDFYSPLNRRGAEILVYGITAEEFREYGENLYRNSYDGLRRLANDRGWLLYQAHPFRERSKRVPPEFLDGVEVYNGNPRHINANAIAAIYAEKHRLKPSAGSDFHQAGDVKSGICFRDKITDEKALAAALSSDAFRIFKNIKKLKQVSEKDISET